jgi:hypothetical protein
MLGSDRSWGEDWCSPAAESGWGDAFIAVSREGGEFSGDMKEPVFENSIIYGIHSREAREAGHGKETGSSGEGTSDDRKIKKDTRSTHKEAVVPRGDEDVDAVWHRGSGPRNF